MLILTNEGTLDGAQFLSRASVEAMTTPTGLRRADGWLQGLGLDGREDLWGRQVGVRTVSIAVPPTPFF
jgi:hypothetical protein